MAPNVEAVLKWVTKNRPDTLDHVKGIIEGPRGSLKEGLLFLLLVGFAAGRMYQREHPTLGENDYHRSI